MVVVLVIIMVAIVVRVAITITNDRYTVLEQLARLMVVMVHHLLS